MSKSVTYPLIIIGILFFVFGFITWANGVLIPYFGVGLELSNFQSTWVVFSSYVAYFVMAIPSAWILKRTGYKKGMLIGLLVMAAGTLLFIPAAYIRGYWLFLTGLFVTGTGLALLQTAANPYVAVIGPIESTAKRIGFMGLANKIAGLVSIAALGSLFLADADHVISRIAEAGPEEKTVILDNYILGVVKPYLVITAVLALLGAMIWYSKLPEVNESSGIDVADDAGPKRSVFQFPNLIFGVIALFFSSACEVIPIDGIILYGSALGIPIAESRFFAQYTLVAMTLGYAASIFLIPKYLSQQNALLACTIWGILMTIGSYATDGVVSVSFVIAMGFSSAMLWGTIWGLALKGLGRFTKIGSALLLMSVVGGGIFPVVFGRLMDINLSMPQNAILLLIPCNLVMMGYALGGYRTRTRRRYAVKALSVVLASASLFSCDRHPAGVGHDETETVRASAKYVDEVKAIAARDDVRACLATIESLNAETRAHHIYLNEIPAPPFNEHERAEEFARLLDLSGADSVWVDSIGNVLALRKGTDGGGTVVIDAHLDTVFPGGTDVSVTQRGDTLFAPGISDNSRSLAMLLTILKSMHQHDIRTSADLLFVGTVGEEGEGDLRGVKHLFSASFPIRSFISLDIGDLGVVTHQGIGSLRYKVTFTGPGGHSFGDFGKVSPHFALATALSTWEQEAADYVGGLAEKATFSAGVIGGGTSVNSIPSESWVTLDTRAEKKQHLHRLGALLQTSIHQSVQSANARKKNGTDLQVEVDIIGDRPTGLTPVDTPLVQRALAALEMMGYTGSLRVSSTNSNVPMSLGIPAITIGQGGKSGGVHSLDEWWLDEEGIEGIQLVLLVILSEARAAALS